MANPASPKGAGSAGAHVPAVAGVAALASEPRLGSPGRIVADSIERLLLPRLRHCSDLGAKVRLVRDATRGLRRAARTAR